MSCFASYGNIASDNTITTQVQIALGQFEPSLSANDLLHNFNSVFLSTLWLFAIICASTEEMRQEIHRGNREGDDMKLKSPTRAKAGTL